MPAPRQNTRTALFAENPPAAPPDAPSSPPRPTFQAQRAEFFVTRGHCPSHAQNTSLRPTAQARQAALFCAAPLPPSATPEQRTAPSVMFRQRSAHLPKSLPYRRLRQLRLRPSPRCPEPACASIPRPRGLMPSQAKPSKTPLRRTKASAPRTKAHEKTRRKAAHKRETLPRAMRQKASKMPSAR